MTTTSQKVSQLKQTLEEVNELFLERIWEIQNSGLIAPYRGVKGICFQNYTVSFLRRKIEIIKKTIINLQASAEAPPKTLSEQWQMKIASEVASELVLFLESLPIEPESIYAHQIATVQKVSTLLQIDLAPLISKLRWLEHHSE